MLKLLTLSICPKVYSHLLQVQAIWMQMNIWIRRGKARAAIFHQMSASVVPSCTTRLSVGVRPVLAPDSVASAPLDTHGPAPAPLSANLQRSHRHNQFQYAAA
jgi:hypothetical protein